MNNVPDHILRIFGGPIPVEPVREINPLLVVAGVGILIIAVCIISKRNKEEKQNNLSAI